MSKMVEVTVNSADRKMRKRTLINPEYLEALSQFDTSELFETLGDPDCMLSRRQRMAINAELCNRGY